ncbi:MAG: response regulator transcription factor [Aggregatilineales bacterium]
MPATILFIGYLNGKNKAYVATMEKHYTIEKVRSGKEASNFTSKHTTNLVVLDAVSMHTPGYRICTTIKHHNPNIPIIHIIQKEQITTDDTPANITLHPPINVKHLLTSIEQFINPKQEETVNCGIFTLNIKRRLLTANGKETQIPPKQAKLLEIFFRNPQQILDRKTLMEQVWETDYLGDTRTLDVHIRWLREALEPDSKKPRYLKTVRGVGYCFNCS